MTKRLPVSSIQNKWVDAQRVDLSDMNLEQEHKNSNDAAIVQNFFGSGVLLESPEPNVIFDTNPEFLGQIESALIAANNFDGTGIAPQKQPTDSQQGNQLAVELTNSAVFGRNSTKVLIVGLSFDGRLQYDKFQFHKNETQTTSKHYSRVLTIIFNDFLGNNNCSCHFGGRIIIRETKPFELNRDAKMISQDIMPDIFIRDLRTADCNNSIYTVIQEGVGPAYDVNSLNINITGTDSKRAILAGDVTTQIGQKFLATSDNIQKITLLVGVSRNTEVPIENRFDWDGDLILSIYPLQQSVSCSTDIVPELLIDYDPEERPVAELSFSQPELKSIGYVLTDIPQPVDFVFSNSIVSEPGGIDEGRYYAVTIRRSGNVQNGDLILEKGTNLIEKSRLTIFNGSWVDVVEEDLWFQIWSDSAKHASGQAYDYGSGIISPKIGTDITNGSTIDYNVGNLDFASTGQSVVNTAIIQAQIEESITNQDEKTGNNVFSRKQFIPNFSFVTNLTLDVIKKTSEPLIIGCMTDINPKSTSKISGTTNYPGLARDDSFIVINPNADLLSARLIGRKLIPQTECSTYEYRIMRTEICVDGYGDVDGDGYITMKDVFSASLLIGEGPNIDSTQQAIIDGNIDVLSLLRADVDGDGIVTENDVALIESFVNRSINSFPVGTSFTHLTLQVQPSVGRWDGYHDCCSAMRIEGFGNGCVHDNIVDPFELSEYEREYYGNHGVISTIDNDNNVFKSVPFIPVDFEIEFQPFWQDWLLALSSESKELPSTFTYPNSLKGTTLCDTPLAFDCKERGNEIPSCDPGRNDFYVPGNLIIGNGGGVVRTDGTSLPSDIEIGTLNLELPSELPLVEVSIDLFSNFVMDKGDGFTNAEFAAMRYFDCSTVQPEDLALNKVRFNVSIQSFYPSLDGYSELDGYGITIDDIIGVYIDYEKGILRLNIKDIDYEEFFRTLRTKIQVIVYLKKSGWNNRVITISPEQLSNLAVSPSS